MLKRAFLLIVIFNLAACSVLIEPMPKSWRWGAKPRPLTGVQNFPSTESEYGKGFKDGCGSAWDAVAKGLLSDINERRYDYKRMLKSSDYNTGWWDGFEQCTYVLDWDVV
jgi:hypothetical protein